MGIRFTQTRIFCEGREVHAGGDTGVVDSSESRFDYQRVTTLKGNNPFSRRPLGKRHGVSRFKAAAVRVMKEAEHKKSATKSDAGKFNAANNVSENEK